MNIIYYFEINFENSDQYILAQAPRDASAAKDFFKLLEHVKAEGLIVAEGADEFSRYELWFIAIDLIQRIKLFQKYIFSAITAKFEKGTGKNDFVSTAVIKENGLHLKAIKFCRWAEPLSAIEINDMLEKSRKYLGCPLKGPLVIVCKDGAAKYDFFQY